MNLKFSGMIKNEPFKLLVNDSSNLIMESDNYVFKICKQSNNNFLTSKFNHKTFKIKVDASILEKILTLPIRLNQLSFF